VGAKSTTRNEQHRLRMKGRRESPIFLGDGSSKHYDSFPRKIARFRCSEWGYDQMSSRKSAKETGGVITVLTELDIAILKDLYDYRVLTHQQIKKVHFPNSSYSHKKIHLLREAGYLKTKPFLVKGQKRGAMYFISDDGINALLEEGVIDHPRKAQDNRPENRQLPLLVEIHKLYEELTLYGWKFIESRDIKRHYQMNRNAYIMGGLRSKDGRMYGVYLLEESPHDSTFRTIMTEIKNSVLDRVFIFSKGQDAFERMKEELADPIAQEVNVCSWKFTPDTLKFLRDDSNYQRLFGHFGEVKTIPNKNNFGDYVLTVNGEEKYVMNYLMGDMSAKYFLGRYARERAGIEKRKVMVFAWSYQIDTELKPEFEGNPWVEFVPLTKEAVKSIVEKG